MTAMEVADLSLIFNSLAYAGGTGAIIRNWSKAIIHPNYDLPEDYVSIISALLL